VGSQQRYLSIGRCPGLQNNHLTNFSEIDHLVIWNCNDKRPFCYHSQNQFLEIGWFVGLTEVCLDGNESITVKFKSCRGLRSIKITKAVISMEVWYCEAVKLKTEAGFEEQCDYVKRDDAIIKCS
jgi:hypothetical protein